MMYTLVSLITARRSTIIHVLLSLDVYEADTRLLTCLYWNQTAALWCDWMCIKQGVRQGCVASPHLFVLYTEMIMRAIDELDGFKIGEKLSIV